MSLSLYRVPDGQQGKGQSAAPCPSVYSPAPALGSLSSVALSSVQATGNLTQSTSPSANYRQFRIKISSGFLREATIPIWSGFLREAISLASTVLVWIGYLGLALTRGRDIYQAGGLSVVRIRAFRSIV